MTTESAPAVTLDELRARHPHWVVRETPRPSATCTVPTEAWQRKLFRDLAMNVYADSLNELAEMLAEQDDLRAKVARS
jgi:hypothetical protein